MITWPLAHRLNFCANWNRSECNKNDNPQTWSCRRMSKIIWPPNYLHFKKHVHLCVRYAEKGVLIQDLEDHGQCCVFFLPEASKGNERWHLNLQQGALWLCVFMGFSHSCHVILRIGRTFVSQKQRVLPGFCDTGGRISGGEDVEKCVNWEPRGK